MTISICRVCNSRFIHEADCTDYVHECNSGNATLDNEDVLVMGSWKDYTGSADVQGSHVQVAGIGNTLQGTRAGIEGVDKDPTTVRGNNALIYRARQRLTYKKLK